tara:strand:+ start:1980 stop:3794 length:1815 start_codon:yes stop_codon:yes gene_type:complete
MLVRMKVFEVFACVALASLLPAQIRQPLVGQVLRATGKPLPGAAVTLVESDVDTVGLDPVDVLHATTDRRGRFVVSALRGVRYAGFAVGPEIDGTALVATPVPDLACGRQAELRVVATGTSRRVLLKGLEAWGDCADLHVRLTFSHCPGYYLELPIDNEGMVNVPASSVVATARVHAKTGDRLVGVWIPSDGDGAAEVTGCRWFDVLVVDEQGKPVVGATVAVQYEDRGEDFMTVASYGYARGDSAVTKVDGTARLRCQDWQHPIDRTPDTFVVVASKAGFSEGASGWLYKMSFEDWAMKERAGKKLRIPLRTIKPAAAAVQPKLDLASDAFAGKRAKLFAMANATKVDGARVMNYFLARSYEVEFGADGTWLLPPISPTATELIVQLPPVEGRRVMMLPTMSPQMPSADLSTCERLSLQLLDSGGGPASSASVMLVPRQGGSLHVRHIAPLVPDQAGRVDVLLQRGEWTLLAMDETTWVSTELNEWSGTGPMRLQLEAKPSRRVRVIDTEGQPVVGAKFEVGQFRSGFPSPFGIPRVLSQLGYNTFGGHIRRATTDDNGEATLHFLPWPNTQPTAYAYLGSFKVRSKDTAILEGEDMLVIQLN